MDNLIELLILAYWIPSSLFWFYMLDRKSAETSNWFELLYGSIILGFWWPILVPLRLLGIELEFYFWEQLHK